MENSFDRKLQKIYHLADKASQDLEDKKSLKHALLLIKLNSQTLMHTVRGMTETLERIENIEEDIKRGLMEESLEVSDIENLDKDIEFVIKGGQTKKI